MKFLIKGGLVTKALELSILKKRKTKILLIIIIDSRSNVAHNMLLKLACPFCCLVECYHNDSIWQAFGKVVLVTH